MGAESKARAERGVQASYPKGFEATFCTLQDGEGPSTQLDDNDELAPPTVTPAISCA